MKADIFWGIVEVYKMEKLVLMVMFPMIISLAFIFDENGILKIVKKTIFVKSAMIG